MTAADANTHEGRVVGFFHAGVTVRDMEASLRFYRDALGLEPLSRGRSGGPDAERIWGMPVAGVDVAFLEVPGSEVLIEMFEFEGIERHSASARPCDYGAGHLCLYVGDVEAVWRRLRAAGFHARGEGPVTISAGPHAGARAIYTIDPDGYHVELYQRPARP